MDYHERLIRVLYENQKNIVDSANLLARLIVSTTRQNRRVFICGNGGSASTAEHFEIDLSFIRIANKSIKGIPSVTALTSNSAVMSAISNDRDYSEIFSIQLARKAKEGDLLIVISCSGNSPNLLEAVRYCRANGILTFGLLGFDGGLLKRMCDNVLVVASDKNEYGVVEDIHLSICHRVTENIKQFLSEDIIKTSQL